MAEASSFRSVHLSEFPPVTKEVLEALPVSLVKQKLIIPLVREGGRLTAAVPNAEGVLKPQGLQMIAHCPVDLVLAPLDEIIAFIKRYYGDELSQTHTVSTGPTLPTALSTLIEESLQNKVSEILIEMSGGQLRVRQRIRNVLMTHLQAHLSSSQVEEIFELIKKHGKNQKKGTVEWAAWDFGTTFRSVAFTCSAVLSATGDFTLLTLRLQSNEEKMFSPASWGLGPHQARIFEMLLQKKQGVLLFCGRDSDDFQSNLRACAKELSTAERHVVSVSNTGREWLPGVENLVSDGTDVHFSELLSLAFRHQPDVLLVDALEKSEHRELCLREAMKGPLVLSHGYARDASEALVAMLGVESDPALLATSLLGIVAQRSLRLNCPRCQEKDPIHRDRIRDMGIPVAIQPPAFFRGKGCEACFKTGFDREINIFEVIEMNDDMRALLNRNLKAEDIRTYLKSSGFLSLRQVAVHKAINGQTSIAEVLRVTP